MSFHFSIRIQNEIWFFWNRKHSNQLSQRNLKTSLFFAQVGVHQLSINFLIVTQYGLLLEAFFPFSSFVPYLSLQRSLPAFIYIASSLLFMPCCVPAPLSTPGYAPNTVFLSYSKKREQTFILPYLVTTQRQDKQVVFTSGSQTYLKKKKKKSDSHCTCSKQCKKKWVLYHLLHWTCLQWKQRRITLQRTTKPHNICFIWNTNGCESS